jgi:hypothetical protein
MHAISEVAAAFSTKIVEQHSRLRKIEVALEPVRPVVSRPWYRRISGAAWNLFRRL